MSRWLLCLLLFALPASAADATGFTQAPGCPPLGMGDLHLENWKGQKLEKVVILKVPWDLVFLAESGKWFDVHAMECAPTGPCADASHASIQVQRISRKFSFRFGRRIFSAAEGNFSFQMPGGSANWKDRSRPTCTTPRSRISVSERRMALRRVAHI